MTKKLFNFFTMGLLFQVMGVTLFSSIDRMARETAHPEDPEAFHFSKQE
jgi:hypothetical protein